MKRLGLNELRKLFIDFYKSKDHYAAPSAPLVPQNDKSLLLINSGMAPLKPYFSGQLTPPSKRMTTCQKCIRTGDIENVGYTARHGTFFEMLGNFSFGDYFKKESLNWGWEFITEYLEMDPERIWATIYLDDDEAYEIWREIGIPDERIVRLGKEDNFWEIGLGPCGPDSEIFYDRGEEYGCGKPDCKPGCDCDRYIEFWNHVFTQFSREQDGSYTPLAHPNIDTGMGLERIACLSQDVMSIFEVDTIRHIVDAVSDLAHLEYGKDEKGADVSIRIITDHLRSTVFMISDGIIPANEGRGYVLRRLIRRAARHGRRLGIEEGFLTDLSDKVVEVSGDAYPELKEKQEYIKRIISAEEKQFASTLSQGEVIISEFIKKLADAGITTLSGDKVFKLYDTYGFPVELTEEILAEKNITADKDGFEECMRIQKETARKGRKDTDDTGWDEDSIDLDLEPTAFTGYGENCGSGTILAIYGKDTVYDSVPEDEEVNIVLDSTPFYAESGGQIYDTGIMSTDDGVFTVSSVTKKKDVFLHRGVLKEGTINTGDRVILAIDKIRRNRIARNHSATHLLHKALRQTLGNHVEQAGSLVTDDELRFDFNHFQQMTTDELAEVERIVNEQIESFLSVNTVETDIDNAREMGAMALFGEKYGDMVRVVSMGDFSVELCGGTHVDNTGQIGSFKITSESGIASGVRRITAVTGNGVLQIARNKGILVDIVSDALKSRPDQLMNKAQQIMSQVKDLKKEIDDLKKEDMSSGLDDMLKSAKVIGDRKLIVKRFTGMNVKDLRSLSDDIRAKADHTVAVLASVDGDKVNIIVAVTDDLLDGGVHAGKMIKEIAAKVAGGGGGKADMAQAGGKDPSGLDDAFEVAESLMS